MNETFHGIANSTESSGQVIGESLKSVFNTMDATNVEEFEKLTGISTKGKSINEVINDLVEKAK